MIGKSLDWIDCWLTRLIQFLVGVVTLIMVGSLLIGVVYRYVLQDALTWSDEVALLSFTWIVFLTAALMVRDDGHVRIELIEKVLPRTLNYLLTQIIWIAIVVVGLFVIWTGITFIDFTAGQTSPAIRYPTWLRSGAFPVSGAFIAFYALRKLCRIETPTASTKDSS